jgi:hypothetical protein
LLISNSPAHETLSIDLEASLDDDTDSVSLNPIKFIPSVPYPRIEIKGSYRGFIFLLFNSSFYLWNPSTGLHKKIHLSPLSFNLDAYAHANSFYCFWYDRSRDDYLIVSMSSDINSSYWEFFSLRANKWKQIDEGTHIYYSNAVGDYGK